jgi:putative flippase GtrA
MNENATGLMRVIDFVKLHLKRGSKFATVGAIGFFVDAFFLFLFVQYGHVWYILAELFATLIAFVNNYLLDYYWTFYDVLKKSVKGTK